MTTAASIGAVTPAEAIRLQLLAWPEVEAYLDRCRAVILPLGSTEQHGPTGAIGTDALTAEAIAIELGCRSGVLVAPTQAFGMAEPAALDPAGGAARHRAVTGRPWL